MVRKSKYLQPFGPDDVKDIAMTATRIPERNLREVRELGEIDVATRSLLIELFARGYTTRYIRKYIAQEMQLAITDQLLVTAALALEIDVANYRDEFAKTSLSQGLARKAERVRRLNEVAEAFETPAKEGSVKAAETFIKILKQVQEEMEPTGIDVYVIKGDPWYDLLSQLKPTTTPLLNSPENPSESSPSDQVIEVQAKSPSD